MDPYALTERWLDANAGDYGARPRVHADILAVLRAVPSLRPKADIFTWDDGRTQRLLCLHGLVPITFRSAAYHIPVAIWVTRDYPSAPPLVFVVPTADMLIKQSKHVDLSGRCHIEYAALWQRKHEGCNLLALVHALQAHFARDPPVYAKQKPQQQQSPQPQAYSSKPPPPLPGQPSSPPALPPKPPSSDFRPLSAIQHDLSHTALHQPPEYRPSSVRLSDVSPPPSRHQSLPSWSRSPQPTPLTPPPPPPPTFAAPYATSSPAAYQHRPPPPLPPPTVVPSPPTAIQAPALPPPSIPNLLDQDDLESVSSSESPHTAAQQHRAAPPLPPNPELLRLHTNVHHKLTSRLEAFSQVIAQDSQRLRADQADLLAGDPAVRDEMARLEAVRDVCRTVVSKLSGAVDVAERNVADLRRKGDPEVDELVCSTSIVHNQLINLVAEDNAIEDTIYHLHRALNYGRIDLERFLRTTRVLAEEQFLKRALIERIQNGIPAMDAGGIVHAPQ